MTGRRPADVGLCVVPYDSALLDTRMGAGPRHLVAAGLRERLESCGHVVSQREIHPPGGELRAEIATAFALNRGVAGEVAAIRARGAFPITLAGNCNTAVGTIAGVARAGAAGAEPIGVLWLDAHRHFNTPETTVGGFLDGMALAMVTGRCWSGLAASVPGFTPVPEQNVILVGGRDLDVREAELLSSSAITHLMYDTVAQRLPACIDALSRRVRRLYVHVDLDVLDASEGRANALAGSPGLTLLELLDVLELAASRIPLAAAAITAYDPSCDVSGSVARAALNVAERIAALAWRTHDAT